MFYEHLDTSVLSVRMRSAPKQGRNVLLPRCPDGPQLKGRCGIEPGKFYLFVSPFFMTYVGRYVKTLNFQELVIDDAIYFQYTGRKFGELCREGIKVGGENKTQYDTLPNGTIIPAQ